MSDKKPDFVGFLDVDSSKDEKPRRALLTGKPSEARSLLARFKAERDPRTGSILSTAGDAEKQRQITEAREILAGVRSLTGMSYSRMAGEAGFAASTVSRFMRAQTPRFVIKTGTLTAIVERAVDMTLEDLSSDDMMSVSQLGADDPVPGDWSLRRKTAVELLRLRGRALKMNESRVVSVSAKASLTDSAVRVLGAVEAGVFREAFEIPVEDQETLPIGVERYGPDAFALEVRGDSMDKRFPDGSLIICRPFDPETEKLPDHKFVVAMRRDGRTDQVEATVKRLVRLASGGAYVLIPESNNPVHAPLPLEDLGEFSVYVFAVVVASVTPV
jgi:SOS-response transcriptional repressor LexA